MWICLIILGICNNHILEAEEDKYLSLIKMSLNLERWLVHYWQDYVYGWFNTTLNKEAWQSVSRGSGAILLWRESQCKNAKVNKEWLLLRNKQRERACKVVSSVVQERQRWASFSNVCKDTCWGPGKMSINRQLNGFPNGFHLYSKLFFQDK